MTPAQRSAIIAIVLGAAIAIAKVFGVLPV